MELLCAIQSGPPIAATDGSTVYFDIERSANWSITVSGNRTFSLNNVKNGSKFTILFKQDSTGGRTITWFSNIRWMSNSDSIPKADANSVTIFSFWYISSSEIYGWKSQ